MGVPGSNRGPLACKANAPSRHRSSETVIVRQGPDETTFESPETARHRRSRSHPNTHPAPVRQQARGPQVRRPARDLRGSRSYPLTRHPAAASNDFPTPCRFSSAPAATRPTARVHGECSVRREAVVSTSAPAHRPERASAATPACRPRGSLCGSGAVSRVHSEHESAAIVRMVRTDGAIPMLAARCASIASFSVATEPIQRRRPAL